MVCEEESRLPVSQTTNFLPLVSSWLSGLIIIQRWRGISKGRLKRNGRANPFARNKMVDRRLAWVLPRPAYGIGARRAAVTACAGSEVVG